MGIKKYLGVLVGVALFAFVLAGRDLEEVARVLADSGWALAAMVAWRPVTFLLDAAGWRVLLGPGKAKFRHLLAARWVAESCNTLLPMAQVGGHVVRARLLARQGMEPATAGGVVLVDFTVGVFTQFAFTLGAALLLLPTARELGWSLTAASLVFLLLVAIFAYTQRAGAFSLGAGLVQRMLRGRKLASMVGGAKALDETVRATYRDKKRLAICGVWRLAGWMAKGVETYLALYFLGVPVSLTDALVVEALSTAAASAAFVVPGGLGVRDGSILLLAGLMGVDPSTALALALLKRGRELVLGLPGLAYWLMGESRGRNRQDSEEGQGGQS